jgi:hypothetical protein
MNLRISFLITEVRNLNFVDFILFDTTFRLAVPGYRKTCTRLRRDELLISVIKRDFLI